MNAILEPLIDPDITTLEPSPDAIAAHARSCGATYEQAKQFLTERNRRDLETLTDVAPAMADEIEQQSRLALQATEKAQATIEKRHGLVATLESKLVARARLLALAEHVRQLQTETANLDKLGAATLDAFCDQLTSPCRQTQTSWTTHVEHLSRLTALAPHIPARLKAMQTEAATMLTEIETSASKNKIVLKNLIASLAKRGDLEIAQLHDQGFLSP